MWSGAGDAGFDCGLGKQGREEAMRIILSMDLPLRGKITLRKTRASETIYTRKQVLQMLSE